MNNDGVIGDILAIKNKIIELLKRLWIRIRSFVVRGQTYTPKMERKIFKRRGLGGIRTLLPFVLAGIAIVFLYNNTGVLGAFWGGMGALLQMAFAIVFIVVQFAAMFLFLSQTREETILPGQKAVLTMKDYWGQPYLSKMVKEWISLLQDPVAFIEMGGHMLRGLLLYGKPGTGKTFLAKCVAGEAGVAFISTEGSAFRGMFMGTDVLKMMQFIGKAKKLARQYGACIAFIDEIDALGASRGGVMGQEDVAETFGASYADNMIMGGMGGASSGALTRLLYAMDGVESDNWQDALRAAWYRLVLRREPPVKDSGYVLFMGSTNRPGILDPALIREGRFDIKIEVDPPTRAGRREIVAGYLQKIECTDDVDLEGITDDTNGWTPAKIATAIQKHSVRIAIMEGNRIVNRTHINRALRETEMGIDNPIDLDDEQVKVLAYHEASHAVAQHVLLPDMRITRVSIIRTGAGILGHVAYSETREIRIRSLDKIAKSVMVSLAAREGEKLFCGEAYASVGGDYRQAKARLEYLYQMGFFGPPLSSPPVEGHEGRHGGKEGILKKYWFELEEQLIRLLTKHKDKVHKLASALIEHETLSSEEVLECLA
jgi:cell division protease FtsH